jgi:hypothetical protein
MTLPRFILDPIKPHNLIKQSRTSRIIVSGNVDVSNWSWSLSDYFSAGTTPLSRFHISYARNIIGFETFKLWENLVLGLT